MHQFNILSVDFRIREKSKDSWANDYTLIKRDHIETFEVDTWMRIRKDVFEAWYKTQTKYRTQADRERDAELEAASMTMPEMARLLLITRKEVYNILLTGRDKDQFEFVYIADRRRVTNVVRL